MKIIDKAVAKSLDKIRADGRYEYDYLLTPNRTVDLRNRFTRTMLINSVWYGGNDLELKNLYERELPAFKVGALTSDELNYFWAQSTEGLNIRKIHSGLPQLISEKMVDLLLANGYEINLYKDKDFNEEDKDNKIRLQMILDDNNFDCLLQEGIETESWGGGFAYKLSTNTQFEYPIIEVIQPEEYEPTIKAGRIVEDTFISYFKKDNITYKLKETYGVDDKGGYIKYTLYKKIGSLANNDTWFICELSELNETKDLKDIFFPGIFEKFSLYKPNKLPNSEFKGSRLGESDYSGSHGIFDAIDEVLSTMVQEFRDGKIRNFWPDNLLPIDPITNQQYIPPALKKDFVSYKAAIGEKEKPSSVEQTQGEIHSDKYIESYKKLIETALNNAGLSPQTIGVTGLESTAASEESQELREKTSIRTRNRKIGLHEPSLNKLFDLVLKLDDFKNGRKIGTYYINTVFNDYKVETLQDKTLIATQGVAGKTWDITEAVKYVHDEMPEEEQILMVVKIKIENGINTFTKKEEMIYKKFMADVVEESQDEPTEEQINEEAQQEVPLDEMEEVVE